MRIYRLPGSTYRFPVFFCRGMLYYEVQIGRVVMQVRRLKPDYRDCGIMPSKLPAWRVWLDSQR